MKLLSTLFAALMLTATVVHAENYALGVILGDPSGLSGKVKYDNNHSIDGALAYSTGKHSGMQFHSDYLWDRARSWETTQGPLNMYYGLGGRLISYNDDHDNAKVSIGPRGSLGLNFNVNNPNIELFGELAMILEVAPSMTADLDAGVGARIRF